MKAVLGAATGAMDATAVDGVMVAAQVGRVSLQEQQMQHSNLCQQGKQRFRRTLANLNCLHST